MKEQDLSPTSPKLDLLLIEDCTSPRAKSERIINSGQSSTASTSSLKNNHVSPKLELALSALNSTRNSSATHSTSNKSTRLFPARQKVTKPPPKPYFISPTRALLDYFELLTDYERNEICTYDEIYFVGADCLKNQGVYDDEEGYYLAQANDHLAYRYEIKDLLGCGTFGHVFHCYDYKRHTEVAVKIIRNKVIYRKAGDLENKILHELAKADPDDVNCIVKKLRSFEFRGHLCLVFELLSLNLYQFLHKNNFQGLSIQLIRRMAVQMFMALKTVHSVGIIHCDLKPDNILLKFENKSSIKVIDFGSACQEGNKVYDYVQSRYYRAPEVVIEAGYNQGIDIWSVGCILFELLTGNPLFPADNEHELFKMHVEVLGMPPAEFIQRGKRSYYYVDASGRLKRQAEPACRPVRVMLETFDEKIIDLVDRCLRWKPEDRIDAEEGLMHTWVKGQRTPNSV